MKNKEEKNYREVNSCRVCKGKNLLRYLNLGKMPLANGLINEKDVFSEKKYPLEVRFCEDCYFSQLSVVVNPKILFKNSRCWMRDRGSISTS